MNNNVILKDLFAVSKQRAKRQNSKFNLTYDQFVKHSLDKCTFCKTEPNHIKTSKIDGSNIKYNKIHRFDRKIEYNSTNSIFLCQFCYRSRNVFDTFKEYREWIERVVNYQKKKQLLKNKEIL